MLKLADKSLNQVRKSLGEETKSRLCIAIYSLLGYKCDHMKASAGIQVLQPCINDCFLAKQRPVQNYRYYLANCKQLIIIDYMNQQVSGIDSKHPHAAA